MHSRIFSALLLSALVAGCSGKKDHTPTGAANSPAPDSSEEILIKAQTLNHLQDFADATRVLEDLLTREPTNRQALALAVRVTHSQGQKKLRDGDRDGCFDWFQKAAGYLDRLMAAYPSLTTHEAEQVPLVRYNQACALARRGQVEPALTALEATLKAGFSDFDHLDKDADLDSLRELPRFKTMVAEAESRQEAAARNYVTDLIAAHRPFDFDFALSDMDDKIVSRKDFAGKVLIVDIWGTWCQPCLMEIPHLVELHRKYRADGLEIVGINYEKDITKGFPRAEVAKTILRFAREHKISYPCVFGDDKTRSQVPEFQGYPTTIFLDRKGRVRLSLVGARPRIELETIVKVLLEEKAD